MSRDWEAAFSSWGNPPGQAEENERAQVEGQIRGALSKWKPLQDKKIRVYSKGSHRRGTNVRRGSDIDIAVELMGDERTGSSFQFTKVHRAEHLSNDQLGLRLIPDFTYTVKDLKKDVHDALENAFGTAGVKWSDKCIKVRENTVLPVDVVPCRTHRRYESLTTSHDGIEIHPDSGGTIINWPQQDDDNGITKNKDTQLRYKRAVRGIKALENEMVEKKILAEVPSFMMECAVYNVGDHRFSDPSNFQNCLRSLQDMARAAADPNIYVKWLEVNRLKWLFRDTQTWTISDMKRLVDGAFRYIEAG